MKNGAEATSVWGAFSASISNLVSSFQHSVVAVHAGARSTSSGVVWRPGVVVTVRQSIRRRDGANVILNATDKPIGATLAGIDPGTDLAVLRIDSDTLKPATLSLEQDQRVGDFVLAIGRSGLGDISASAGILARLGAEWRTWHGGNLDRLIRPDVRLYVGQAGSALVDEQGRVLGINSNALARNAVITVPAATVNRVVDALLERGSMPKPYLGLAMQPVPLPESARAQFPQGAEQALLVMHLEPGAPAITGGVLVGDLILSIGGDPVEGMADFQHRLAKLKAGDTVPLTVIRGGTQLTLSLKVAYRD
ncbi:MAG: S1C family serine protease [Acidobacteriaceae bacterium]